MMNDSTTRAIAVRSLRRRLWRAFQQEDVDTAIRAYTATRADYEAWIQAEEEEKRQEQERQEKARLQQLQQKRDARPVALKKFGSLKLGRQSSQRRKSSNKQAEVASHQQHPIVHTWDEDDFLLIKEMDPSNVFVADDFKSPDDPYEMDTEGTATTSFRNESNRRKSKGPRFAGFFRMRGSRDEASDDEDDSGEEEDSDMFFTTPLHEAARLGSGELIRLFLERGGLPNLKNGMQRTALHMAAGGLTVEEEKLLIARAMENGQDKSLLEDVGIRIPVVATPDSNGDDSEEHPAAAGAKKAVVAVRRLFALGNNPDKDTEGVTERELPREPFDTVRLNELLAQRMDAVLAILSWCHPDDGTVSANEGPSINSVDARGRTALHYAAELGRTDICIAVVSSFGAILTIVDESSRTPCELAGEQSHSDLAAQLEARALLYADPYGVDDELMASVLSEEGDNGENRNDPKQAHLRLAVPFSWFETLNTVQVRQERNARTEKGMMKLHKILVDLQEQEEANEVMFNYDVNDSMDSMPQRDIAVGLPFVEEDQGSNEETEDTIHMLADAGIDEGHPPSPPPECGRKGDTLSAEQQPSPDLAEIEHEPVGSNHPSPNQSRYEYLLTSLQESHVESYLTFHNWELESASMVGCFKQNPFKALSDAGVSFTMDKPSSKWEATSPQTCLICFDEFAAGSVDWVNFTGCDHGFCAQCVGDYVADCARSRTGGITVKCPHHRCNVSMTQSELQRLAPNPNVYESLLDAADENFVASSNDLKFCPYAGCDGVVHRLVPSIIAQEGFDNDITDITGATCVSYPEGDEDAPLTYEGVRDWRYIMARGSTQPHSAHRFCFACGDKTVHWPVPCDTLEDWKKKVKVEISEVDGESEGEDNYQDVAQRLWMKANTRPCPQCGVAIEKADGCNHMSCRNKFCRYEFCWICRKDWKLHNSDTGGFFRCNRWEGEEDHEFYDGEDHEPRQRSDSNNGTEPDEANAEGYGSALHSSRVAFKKASEMKRFLHHFSRWNAHKESAALERKMANTVCERLSAVIDAAIEFNGDASFDFGGKGLSFVHAAFTELLECRSFLQHSYAFAFFRYPKLYYIRRNRVVKLRHREKASFEEFQSELEMLTEQMSDIVARKHLRATQTQITFLTSEAAEKRRNFSSFIITVLDDERREKKAKKRQEEVGDTPIVSIPPPIDVSEIIERLQARAPLRNEHNDMDSDDGIGVNNPYVNRSHEEQDDGDFEEAEMQEALQASLLTFSAETGSSTAGAGDVGSDDLDTEGSGTLIGEWTCEACTYTNTQGSSCAMCGTIRSEEDTSDDSDGYEEAQQV